MSRAHIVAIVPAAGRGTRMGGGIPKQFLALAGVPVLVHSLRVLEAMPAVTQVIIAAPQADREYCLREIVTPYHFSKVHKIVAGGERRQDSVRHALLEVPDDVETVLVHDAVRPLVTPDVVARVLERALSAGAAIAAIPMRDTVKRGDGFIEATVDRGRLWLAQTPQAFGAKALRQAHQKAHLEHFHATDDAQLLEWMGLPVALVEGSEENIKITRPDDLVIGEAILAARQRKEKGVISDR
jgi:2-C-methyl-D-erythritol 4-phosphate cytidylyltransferase